MIVLIRKRFKKIRLPDSILIIIKSSIWPKTASNWPAIVETTLCISSWDSQLPFLPHITLYDHRIRVSLRNFTAAFDLVSRVKSLPGKPPKFQVILFRKMPFYCRKSSYSTSMIFCTRNNFVELDAILIWHLMRWLIFVAVDLIRPKSRN